MKRRKFLQKGLATAVGVGFLTGIYSWKIEPFWLEFVRVKMPVKNLPEKLIGKTIMQISDMHVGDRFDWGYIIDSFKEAQQLKPDIVVYTGDFVNYKDTEQIGQLTTVFEHVVTGELATIGVLGNHDYGKNWAENTVADSITDVLKKAGVHILRNDKENIEGLNIIGIDDYWGTNFHPSEVMNTLDTSAANLVLCHNPDVCDLDVWNGYTDWVLSGHTHGGQVKPPFLPAPMLPVKNKKYAAGKIPLNDGRTLYINRALGHLWQVRFNVRPEITIFELSKA